MELKKNKKEFEDRLITIYTKEECNSLFFIVIEEYFGISKTDYLLNDDRVLSDEEQMKFEDVLEGLSKSVPIQYMTGKADFMGEKILVNENVLIPRMETEELVEMIILQNKNKGKLKVLDLCTGSGCIAVMLAKSLDCERVMGVDVSAKALDVARENGKAMEVDVDWRHADLLDEQQDSFIHGNRWDIIVANPPYVTKSEKVQMRDNVLNNEPHLALFVEDEDPLIFYEEIIKKAKTAIEDDGVLYFEINEKYGRKILRLAERHRFYGEVIKDLNGKDRFVKLKKVVRVDREVKNISQGIVYAVLSLLGIGVLGYGVFLLKSVIIYVVIAIVVSLIGEPISRFLQRRLKMKPFFSVLVVLLLLILFFVGLFSLFIPMIIDQSKNISSIDFEKVRVEIEDGIKMLCEKVGISVNFDIVGTLTSVFKLNKLTEIINSAITVLGDIGVGLFSVIFIVFYLLKDGEKITEAGISTLDRRYVPRVRSAIRQIKELLSRYFLGLVIQITALFLILLAVLLIFSVENAVTIAFLCSLLNLIPYVGPLIGIVVMAGLTMLGMAGQDFMTVVFPKTMYVMIGFYVSQFIDNYINQPIIFSNSVKSHPLEIFLVTIASGMLFGIIGMVIAVPLYTVIKVILKVSFPDNKIVKLLTKDMQK